MCALSILPSEQRKDQRLHTGVFRTSVLRKQIRGAKEVSLGKVLAATPGPALRSQHPQGLGWGGEQGEADVLSLEQ